MPLRNSAPPLPFAPRRPWLVLALASLLGAGLAVPLAAQDANDGPDLPDEATLAEVLGKPALRFPGEGVLHFYWWRREIPVTWQGRPVEVFEGQSLRLSVQKAKEECIASGHWLVFADEAIPVVSTLTEGGLRVTSLVPRFPGATPQPFELRFLGRGSERELADPVKRALDVLDGIRSERATPPTSGAEGPSDVTEQALEGVFGCKAEMKDGVALFRLPGPRGFDGLPAGSRMGIAVFAAFAGTDDAARARIDWAMRPHEVPAILRELGSHGFALESLTAAAPGYEDDLAQVALVGSGKALDLAKAVKAELESVDVEPIAAEASFQKPSAPEVLGLASGALAGGFQRDATQPEGPQRATWEVHQEDGANVLSMKDDGGIGEHAFNLLWTDRVPFQDGTITLRMRADGGRIDQGGGPVWRVQDANDYYICRFNPLEQDFRVYRVKDGIREQIQAIGGLPFPSGEWFTIQVTQEGDRITCTLNGTVKLQVRDETFPMSGGVGIWSKADSQPSVEGLWVETKGERAGG